MGNSYADGALFIIDLCCLLWINWAFRMLLTSPWVTRHHCQLCTAGCPDAIVHADVTCFKEICIPVQTAATTQKLPHWVRRSILQGHTLVYVSARHVSWLVLDSKMQCNHTNKESRAAQVLLHQYKRLPGVKANAAGLRASCRRVRGPRAVRAAW